MARKKVTKPEVSNIGGGPGYARLRSHPDYDGMVQRTLAEQQRALSEVGHPRTLAKPATRKDKYPEPKRRK